MYKDKKGEEIFIEDEDGKIYTFDKHPKRRVPLKTFTNVVVIVDKEKLKEKTKIKKLLKRLEIFLEIERKRQDSLTFCIKMLK